MADPLPSAAVPPSGTADNAEATPQQQQPQLPQPRAGRCEFYMARKQRYCTVVLDGRALREGWRFCPDHKTLVDAAGGVAPSPADGNRREKKKKNSRGAEAEVLAEAESGDVENKSSTHPKPVKAEDDDRVPCPFSTLHTVRKANYWQHLKVCPHRPSPSVQHCTVVDCNIADVSKRRPAGERRPLFADFSEADRDAFIAWVEERYEALGVEASIIALPFAAERSTAASSSSATASTEAPLSVASYIRPSLLDYVASGREKEALQHVALANLADLAFFTAQQSDSCGAAQDFASAVVRPDAMRARADAIAAAQLPQYPAAAVSSTADDADDASASAREAGTDACFVEYGAGKGGLVAAMRRAWPLVPTIVVDRDMFRDMKDASVGASQRRAGRSGKRGRGGVEEETAEVTVDAAAEAAFLRRVAAVPHVRLKMDCKDFSIDRCVEGLALGVVETSLSRVPPTQTQGNDAKGGAEGESSLVSSGSPPVITSSTRLVALGKHLCGGCTDMALRSVAEGKAAAAGGVLIATCCHHMCSEDTYVWPALLTGGNPPLAPRALLDCCCGTAGWGISGEAVDARRRLVGRKVKRLLDFGRVAYLRAARHPDGSGRPLFAFVGMVRYISAGVTEENEALIAIP